MGLKLYPILLQKPLRSGYLQLPSALPYLLFSFPLTPSELCLPSLWDVSGRWLGAQWPWPPDDWTQWLLCCSYWNSAGIWHTVCQTLLPEGLFSFCFCDTKVFLLLAGSLLDFKYWSSFSIFILPLGGSIPQLEYHLQPSCSVASSERGISLSSNLRKSPYHRHHHTHGICHHTVLLHILHSWQRRKTPLDIFIFICLPSACLPPSPHLHYIHTLDYNLYFFLFTSLEEYLALKSILVEWMNGL